MTSVKDLGARRKRLVAELGAVEAELRDAAVSAVQSGRPLAVVAREAGVTRPTLYAWLRAGRTAEQRLAEIDARYDRLVGLLVKTLEPAGDYSRKGNWRSGLQWEQNGRSGSSRARLEAAASELLGRLDILEPVDRDMVRQCAQEAGFSAQSGDVLAVVVAELDTAYALRKQLESEHDPFAD